MLGTRMTNRRQNIRSGMRPNIGITHQLNGRVKGSAAANGLDLDDASQHIIKAGLDELEGDREQ